MQLTFSSLLSPRCVLQARQSHSPRCRRPNIFRRASLARSGCPLPRGQRSCTRGPVARRRDQHRARGRTQPRRRDFSGHKGSFLRGDWSPVWRLPLARVTASGLNVRDRGLEPGEGSRTRVPEPGLFPKILTLEGVSSEAWPHHAKVGHCHLTPPWPQQLSHVTRKLTRAPDTTARTRPYN